MFRQHVANNPKTHLMTNQDHSERYQPSPDGEFQSEHFGKHKSMSMEGYATNLYSAKHEKDLLLFYSFLSDEKRQDSGTIAEKIVHCYMTYFIEKR